MTGHIFGWTSWLSACFYAGLLAPIFDETSTRARLDGKSSEFSLILKSKRMGEEKSGAE